MVTSRTAELLNEDGVVVFTRVNRGGPLNTQHSQHQPKPRTEEDGFAAADYVLQEEVCNELVQLGSNLVIESRIWNLRVSFVNIITVDREYPWLLNLQK